MQISNLNRYHISTKNIYNNTSKNYAKRNVKKFLPMMVFALMPLSLISQINSSGIEKQKKEEEKKYNIEYYNVKSSTKTSIENSLNDLINNSKNVDFLDYVNFSITKNFNRLETDDAFRTYLNQNMTKYSKQVKGFSFYSDIIKRSICIQEAPHKNIWGINGKTNKSKLEFTLMHEIGHQFDQYYGHDHNSETAIEWKEVQAKRFKEDSLSVFTSPTNKEDYRVKSKYSEQNCLNDNEKFKNAYYKDLLSILKMRKNNSKNLAENINYFAPGYEYLKNITLEKVDKLDAYRAETYANLFAYIVGEDDGNKEFFIKNFENCYNVVKEDIKKFIGFE